LIEISQDDVKWLIKEKHLVCKQGKFPDLVVSCRNKKSKRKKPQVPEPIANKLKLRNKKLK
jgi:hypothetical protein